MIILVLQIVGFGLVGVTWYSLYRASLNLESPWLYLRAPAVAALVGLFWGLGLGWPQAIAYNNIALSLRAGFYFALGSWLITWLYPQMAEDEFDLDTPPGLEDARSSWIR